MLNRLKTSGDVERMEDVLRDGGSSGEELKNIVVFLSLSMVVLVEVGVNMAMDCFGAVENVMLLESCGVSTVNCL